MKPEVFDVQDYPNTLIPLSDSINLSALLWLPKTSCPTKLSTILEYLPYGYNTGTADRDHITHRFFTSHGFACIRVDMRGSGESQGLLFDEYLPQEQKDCIEVMEWIEKQSWSNGKIGMIGISWGGFNALQVAYLRPKQLKAIITLCSTDDRYADDIHFKGGSLLCENLGWAACMQFFSSTIPDPLFNCDWESVWLYRLKNRVNWVLPWLVNFERNDYWKSGSVCEDFSKIKVPTYIFGGWGDCYKNAAFRLCQNLQCPRKMVVGPWAHKYPHLAVPEPRIGFLSMALRFWDFWLNEKTDNSAMDEPNAVCYILKSHKPKPSHKKLEGYWVVSDGQEFIKRELLYLNSGGLEKVMKEDSNKPVKAQTSLNCGKNSGEFIAICLGPEWPTDQRDDDAKSIVFETEPFEKNVPFLGQAKLKLFASSNKTSGQLIVRLNEVHQSGEVTRITYGVLNLCYHSGFEKSLDLVPEQVYEVTIELDYFGYEIATGNKLRLSISTEYFPIIFPLSEKPTITVHLEKGCLLDLPLFIGQKLDQTPFPEVDPCDPLNLQCIKPEENQRKVIEDIKEESIQTDIVDDFGVYKYPNGMIIGMRCEESYWAKISDPLTAKIEIKWEYLAEREELGIKVEVVNRVRFEGVAEFFTVSADIEAKKNGVEVYRDEKIDNIKRKNI